MTQKKAFENGQFEWEYCGVQLQMTSVLEDEKQMIDYVCPSIVDGLTESEAYDLRIAGCELIQVSGQLLRLPQVAMATGQVLFQRFFHTKSFVRHDYEHYAMGCINLAAKIEECPRRLRDTINVFHHMRQAREQRPFEPLIPDQDYVNLKNQIIRAERRILKELGFCVHVKHPHKLIICYLQFLGEEKNRYLVQCAWNYMNDSLRTRVFVCYHPETIACACIYLAARQLNLPLPESSNENVDWWNVFNVKESSMRAICYEILQLYNRGKPTNAKLESRLLELHELRRRQLEKRQRQRNIARIKKLAVVTEVNRESQQNQKVKQDNTTSDAPDSESQNGCLFNVEECSLFNSQKKRSHFKKPRRERHKSQSKTPDYYRHPSGHSRSRSPGHNHSKNDKITRSRRHSNRRKYLSSSHSPVSDRFGQLYDGEKGYLSRRTRYQLRSPVTHHNSFGPGFHKFKKYNHYYDTLKVNGRSKIHRN